MLSGMSDDPYDLRDKLRGLRVFDLELPRFDPESAPEIPDQLFALWLGHAVEAGVRDPHAMTLCTVDASGHPNSRMLILRRLAECRWGFASSRASRKGMELKQQPWAALNFYWREVGRQVRVRGRIVDAGAEEAARDFLARSAASRAESWAGNQSQVLNAAEELEASFDETRERIAAEPDAVPEHWARYDLLADEVEFWQADPDRRHIRLSYQLRAGAWARQRLWP